MKKHNIERSFVSRCRVLRTLVCADPSTKGRCWVDALQADVYTQHRDSYLFSTFYFLITSNTTGAYMEFLILSANSDLKFYDITIFRKEVKEGFYVRKEKDILYKDEWIREGKARIKVGQA